MTCACGNAARYITADGRFTCATCPLKEGVDSLRLADAPALLAWARRFLARPAKVETGHLAEFQRTLREIVGKDISQP